MIQDLLDVYRKNADGDQLAIDNYHLKEGLYIKICNDSDQMEILRIEKTNKYSGPLWEFFKTADFYSRLVDIYKPVAAKQIHSNNIYAVTFKAGLCKDKPKEWADSIQRYYETLGTPKKNDEKILAPYQLPPRSKEILEQNCRKIMSLMERVKQLISEYKIKPNVYVKIYFQAEVADYVRESKRYLIPKIFNKNAYNVFINEDVYGLSNNNIGMNEKKPFLEHKTTGFRVPFRITVQNALDAQNLFSWLDGQKDDEGKGISSGYLPVDATDVFHLEKNNKKSMGAYYIHIEKGTQPVIDDYDFLPGITEKLEPGMICENYLQIKGFETQLITSKMAMEAMMDELLFDGNLRKNYYEKKPKSNGSLNNFQMSLLVRYKGALHNYFRKNDSTGILTCIDPLSKELLRQMLYDESAKKMNETSVVKGMNFRLSLLQYFNVKGKGHMGEYSRGLWTKLKDQLINISTDQTVDHPIEKNMYCENDEEFYFYAGQLVQYLVSLSRAQQPNYYILRPIMDAKNGAAFKTEVLRLHKKYDHSISMYNERYKKLLSAVMGYRTEENPECHFDMFMAGVASQCIIYLKGEKK